MRTLDVSVGSGIAPLLSATPCATPLEVPTGYFGDVQLDVEFVRSQFPAFDSAINAGQSFFDCAAGSYSCRQTIDALTAYYTDTKVQPYSEFESSDRAGQEMDQARDRWAEALGVQSREVVFGPSTSMNTYVLAHAFGDILTAGNEIIVTNQDHEANTGAFRRMADRVGCKLREWRMDPITGALDIEDFEQLLSDRTGLVTVPHASNIIGQENDIARIVALSHKVGARVVVDGVSFAPHSVPDVSALAADVYLFSLYKMYSVHQGLMVVRGGLLTELPNQGHFFNADFPDKRLNPAGPDHAQVAASGAVLDYVLALHQHHGGSSNDGLRLAARVVSELWREREDVISQALLGLLSERDDVRVLGPVSVVPGRLHRCPTIAFSPLAMEPDRVAHELVLRGVQTTSGDFYAVRTLEGLGLDSGRGVVRLSGVHYTSPDDVDRVTTALTEVLS